MLQCSESTDRKHPTQTPRQLAQQLLGPESWQRFGLGVTCCAALFWLLQTWHSSSTLPTHWTSSCDNSSYSQRRNWCSRGDILTALKRSGQIIGRDEISLGSLYQCRGELFRRGWRQVVKLCQKNFGNFWIAPRMWYFSCMSSSWPLSLLPW